ncbi:MULTISPECIES: extracellular solute-binding protein [Ferrimicrobium]|jgi:molybdate/tungstate transport system substrate-binding protein|uniref:Extracellular solute-binding protein n=1 Tax=Ferrimicrobium acidiphilum TaxID=121039 RepID=A0ABV3Y010_9ACTN|nr:extracellular solute-binding protein [Ferrimicrobium sp.]
MIARLLVSALIVATGAVTLAACGTGGARSATHQTADVAYAGSLQLLNEHTIGPAFAKATGYGYLGRGAGSFGLSKEIAAGEIAPNVFESIGSAPITELEPARTSWYVSFAASPIVVAYNPHTAYAPTLKLISEGKLPLTRLFSLLDTKGFLLGRTNPNTDPQGQAFCEMIDLAIRRYHLPRSLFTKILGPLDNPSQVFSETSLEARLSAGQLDAASAFESQAIELHLPYVALPPAINFGDPNLARTYATAKLTLAKGSVVHGVPLLVDATVIGHTDTLAADAFVRYQLNGPGKQAFIRAGYTSFPPIFVGTGVPKSVRDAR